MHALRWVATAWAAALLLGGALPATAASAAADAADYVHVAEPGDTLIGLGRRFLVDPRAWPELQRLNAVKDPRRIPVGTELRLPLRLLRVEPVPATVASQRGSVRVGGQPLAPGQALPEGSDVATGSDGQLTVRLVDGTVLRLRADSRMAIDQSHRISGAQAARSGVRLEQGRVEVQAPPTRGGRAGFRVQTPQGVLAVRGTEFRVAATAQGTTLGEVLEGVVGVRGSVAAESRVAAGSGTAIDAQGRVAPPQPLPAAPDLSALPALHERPLVRLSLPAAAGVQGYRVQVGADPGFDQLLADVSGTGTELRIAGLDDGRHPIRVRAVDARGLEGRDAVGTLTLKARPEPPLPSAPAPRAVIRGSKVEFAWAAASEATRYRLQVRRAEGTWDTPTVDLKDLAATAHAIDGVAPGLYQWRLGSVRANGDAGPWGDALGFEVKPLPPTPAPPAPPQVGDRSVRFFWQGLPGQRFDFQVARDARFAQLLREERLDRTEVELPLPGAAGRYHVRLRAVDADGFVGPWSASQHFDVIACVRDQQAACVRVDGAVLQLQ